MNNALGKVFILFCFSLLNAQDFEYNIQVDKNTPYVKEAVILYFDVNQSNHDIVLFFDFDILKDPSYYAQRIDIQEKDAYHNTQIRYTYLIYPLQDKEIHIAFRLTQKATTDESVAYSFSGDRDNVKTLETKDTVISIPALSLKVKSLPKETLLVGDFSLDYKIPKHKAQSYEPLPMQITIKGKGFPPILENILAKETAFKQFRQKPINTSSTSKKGTHNLVNYTLALSHDSNFTVEAIQIHAFNPLLEKRYRLTLPKQTFIITKPKESTLLDKSDSPAPLAINWQSIKDLLSYLFVFIMGYIFAVFHKEKQYFLKRNKIKIEQPLKSKIQNIRTHKALLQLLMAQNTQAFHSIIEQLEAVCYGEKKVSLEALKKEAQENRHA